MVGRYHFCGLILLRTAIRWLVSRASGFRKFSFPSRPGIRHRRKATESAPSDHSRTPTIKRFGYLLLFSIQSTFDCSEAILLCQVCHSNVKLINFLFYSLEIKEDFFLLFSEVQSIFSIVNSPAIVKHTVRRFKQRGVSQNSLRLCRINSQSSLEVEAGVE